MPEPNPTAIRPLLATVAGRVRAYACTVWGEDPHPATIINARSRGAAGYEFWRGLSDCRPDIPFTAIRVRLNGDGSPVTSEMHRSVLEHRGRPDLVAGARVHVRKCPGTVVGAGSGGSWIQIQYDQPGPVLYVHPADVALDTPVAHPDCVTEAVARG